MTAAIVAVLVVSQVALLRIEAQRRRIQRRPAVQPSAPKKVGDDSAFKHEHHRLPRTKLTCLDCHVITSQETPDVISAATKASIKGYPYHDSCLNCHRLTPPQFFRSASPVVCNVCHTRSSPRLTAKEMLAFPKPKEVRDHELIGYFSHGGDDHQIASRKCASCHLTDTRASVAISAVAGDKDFVPPEGTFKTLPTGHASCFPNCHWDKDKPKKDDCGGCHFTVDALAAKKHSLLSAGAAELLKNWPREWPRRISLKFNHESKNHRVTETSDLVCTSCHVRIRRSEKLEVPDVPISSCAKSGCHFDPETRKSRSSLYREMFEEDDDIAAGRDNDPSSKTGQNTCTGCHTMAIGSAPPPCSHYLPFKDDSDFKSGTKYQNIAKYIAERCKSPETH